MTDPALRSELDAIFAARDRANMAPTIAAFSRLLELHPHDAHVLYEVGGAYDTNGQEEVAADFYERALAAGLEGKWRRQCFVQYGSTLRNVGRLSESLAVFDRALDEFPGSESLVIFRALTLHALGRKDSAIGSLLTLIGDRLDTDEVKRYQAAIRGNGAYLSSLDSAGADVEGPA